jgi:preprotein translocase subunit Sec63
MIAHGNPILSFFFYNTVMIIIGKAVRSQSLFLHLHKCFSQIPKFNADKDYYSILEVNPDAPELDIKRAYYRLAKAYHPDNNPD